MSKQNNNSEKANKQSGKENMSRRSVIKGLAGVGVLSAFGYLSLKKLEHQPEKVDLTDKLGLADAPYIKKSNSGKNKELLRIGIIGFGNRARQLSKSLGYTHPDQMNSLKKAKKLESYMEQENLNVSINGFCEVFEDNAAYAFESLKNEAQPGGGPNLKLPVKRYKNYHELLESDEIDAVVISTPEHHHAQMTIDAVKAGKHVYCEKSFTRTLQEVYDVYDVVKNSDIKFQLGHQISQNVSFQKAKQAIANNLLGKINLVEATTNRNTPRGAWIRHLEGDGTALPGDANSIDWKQWLGDSPDVPFDIKRFYNWSLFKDYGTGTLGQLFTHEFDAVNQLLEIGIPKSVVSSGGIYLYKDFREFPDVIQSVFEYPDRDLTLMYSASLGSSNYRGRVFMGTDAKMELGSDIKITPDGNSSKYKKILEEGLANSDYPMYSFPQEDGVDGVSSATAQYYARRGLVDTKIDGKVVDVTHLHLKEWIDAIRNNGDGKLTANIDKAFEEGIAVQMAHISYVEKRRVEWDPINRKVI